MIIYGKITKISGDEITLKLDNESEISRLFTISENAQPLVEVNVIDKRKATSKQRKMVFALINDIQNFTAGYDDTINPYYLKSYFYNHFEEVTGIEFSLSKASIELTTLFIRAIIQFMYDWDIPFRKGFEPLQEDVEWLIYQQVKHRVCNVCGASGADIHHATNLVSRTMNRKGHDHWNSTFLSLCRIHHTEAHSVGLRTFEEMYHLKPIKLSKETLVKLGLMSKKDL